LRILPCDYEVSKEILVILVDRVVDKTTIMGKNVFR
jgi:hypothetical protein